MLSGSPPRPPVLVDRKRCPEGASLGRGQLIKLVQDGAYELLETCVGDLGLRLDAESSKDPKVRCSLDRVVEERGLAHPGFTPQYERAATMIPCCLEQRIDAPALPFTTEDHLENRLSARED